MMKKSIPAIFSMLSLVNLQNDGEEKGRVHCTKKISRRTITKNIRLPLPRKTGKKIQIYCNFLNIRNYAKIYT